MVTSGIAAGFFSFGIISRFELRRELVRIRSQQNITSIKQQDWYRPSAGEAPPAVVRERHGTERTARRKRPRLLTERVDVVGEMRVHGDQRKNSRMFLNMSAHV